MLTKDWLHLCCLLVLCSSTSADTLEDFNGVNKSAAIAFLVLAVIVLLCAAVMVVFILKKIKIKKHTARISRRAKANYIRTFPEKPSIYDPPSHPPPTHLPPIDGNSNLKSKEKYYSNPGLDESTKGQFDNLQNIHYDNPVLSTFQNTVDNRGETVYDNAGIVMEEIGGSKMA